MTRVIPRRICLSAAACFICGLAMLMLAPNASGHGAYHDIVIEIHAKLKDAPNDPALRHRLAAAHVEHGDWKEALVELERLRRLAPKACHLGYLSGRALATGGMLEAARVELDEFLSAEPAHQAALGERARVLLKLGQVKAGLADYRAALRQPAAPDLYVEAALAFRQHGHLNEASDIANRAVVETRQDPEVLSCAVDCALAAGRVDQAVAHTDLLRKAWPRPEPWMQRKAEILAAAGRDNEARTAWQELHDHIMRLPNLDRAQPFLVEMLGRTRHALGMTSPAAVVAPPAASPLR
ncbi:tetratricopeptide repeat protein [Prosthecobacter sp.]